MVNVWNYKQSEFTPNPRLTYADGLMTENVSWPLIQENATHDNLWQFQVQIVDFLLVSVLPIPNRLPE